MGNLFIDNWHYICLQKSNSSCLCKKSHTEIEHDLKMIYRSFEVTKYFLSWTVHNLTKSGNFTSCAAILSFFLR